LNTPEKQKFTTRRLNTITKAKQRLAYANTKLGDEIKILKSKLEKLTEDVIEDHIQRLNIGSAQAMVLKEIINIAKYSSKYARRYSSDWLLTCLLMSIRSPEMYNFLLKNDILPLPSVRTIKRRMSSVKIECGFDPCFFEGFAKKMEAKTEQQKYGLLIFDEISVRKSLKTDQHSMRYQGVVNFDDEEAKSTNPDDLGDHALVFGFQSLQEDYFQPIACFAAKGATKGVILAKLIIQAILLLEKAGAKVCGIICDGARTNRKMWSEFGISGSLNSTRHYFPNPYDDERKIFVISDMPHLFKCIRNRLLGHELMVCNAYRNSIIFCT